MARFESKIARNEADAVGHPLLRETSSSSEWGCGVPCVLHAVCAAPHVHTPAWPGRFIFRLGLAGKYESGQTTPRYV